MTDYQVECLSESRLRSLRRAGMLSVRNRGPALMLGIIPHGARPLDLNIRAAMESCYQNGLQVLNELFACCANPSAFDGNRLTPIVDGLRNGLIGDIDAALDFCRLSNNDPPLGLHSLNVSVLSMAIGIDLGYDERHIQTIGIAGLVHDVGMLRVSDSIRQSDRKLTDSESLDIQRHPVHTVNILSQMPTIPSLVQLVAYQVHERPDGSGYPRGRDRTSTHPFARILHAADAFLALTSRRPYRPPVMAYEAMVCLLKQAEQNQVESEVIRSLLGSLSLFPIGSHVELSDGRSACVVRANRNDFTRPLVSLEGGNPNHDLLDLSNTDLNVTQARPTPGSGEVPLSPEIANWRVRAASFLAAAGDSRPSGTTRRVTTSVSA